MKQHVTPPSVLALPSLDLLAVVIGGLVPINFHQILATEVVRDLLAVMACETFEVQRGISALVEGDRNHFLLHGGLRLCDKLESYLLTFRRVDRFPSF